MLFFKITWPQENTRMYNPAIISMLREAETSMWNWNLLSVITAMHQISTAIFCLVSIHHTIKKQIIIFIILSIIYICIYIFLKSCFKYFSEKNKQKKTTDLRQDRSGNGKLKMVSTLFLLLAIFAIKVFHTWAQHSCCPNIQERQDDGGKPQKSDRGKADNKCRTIKSTDRARAERTDGWTGKRD